MSTLMLHCGGTGATLAEVRKVPVPKKTDTWFPIPYGDVIDLVKEEAGNAFGKPVKEGYGLTQNGDQLFGLLTYDNGQEHGLSLGFRGSVNKSLAWGYIAGSHIFVCDNLAFTSNAFRVIRKNTKNVWDDLVRLIKETVFRATGEQRSLQKELKLIKRVGCETHRGYEILGHALGTGVLKPHQAAVAFHEWTTPTHKDFVPRNLWSLYNAFTEAVKKGPPGYRIDRQTGVHDFIREVPELKQLAA